MAKKFLTAAVATAAASAIIGTVVVAAAKKYTASDLRGLGDALLGEAPVLEEHDVNTDGRVDVFDMTEMRKALTATGDYAENSFYATEDNVRYIGRNYFADNVTWLVQSGSAVEFTVNAKSAEVTIFGDGNIESAPDYRPRYAVIVDDEIILDETMSEESKTIQLFSGETAKTAKVKIIHLSEANNGTIGVSEIKVNSNAAVPVAPTMPKELQIEFIGDSITCAYGVEGASSGEPFKTTTENFMKSYAYLTAEKLGADYSAVCYSGHGIISGYTSGDKNTDSLVPPYYEMIGKSSDYAKPWDFSKRKNDVVVINLGTNDATYIDKDFDTRSPEFVESYEDFLEMVRKNNPDAYIICTLGTMGCTAEYPLIEEAVANFKANSGDERVMCYLSATQTAADGYGSDWHPTAVTQQKSAYVLADKICQVLGIESDQIGLDMAADAVYDISIDKSTGANAATYFSDYDKSFWINMVDGGPSAESIEAVISGIELKKDGKYRLTFQCTTTAGKELPVIIRSSDKSEVYFSDTFVGDGEKTPFEAEFTAPLSDKSADIILQVGGTNYYNVTLYNLRLEKIG